MVIGFAAALLLAYLGAFGTGPAPALLRLAYWIAVILPGSLIGMAIQEIMRGWGALSHNRWAEIVVVALLISLPHSFMVIVASALFFGIAAITPGLVFDFWIAVLVVSLVLTAINYLAAGEAAAAPPVIPPAPPLAEPAAPAAPGAGTDAPPALPPLPELVAEKLPARLRQARVIAIEAEDHYLRIHTEAGSDLVLMRMTDACALLGEAAGLRVHRSWWVARGAIEARARRSGKLELALVGGLVVPVSRTMYGALRELGLV